MFSCAVDKVLPSGVKIPQRCSNKMSSTMANEIWFHVSDHGDGTYSVIYCFNEKGSYEVSVFMNVHEDMQPIMGSPFTFTAFDPVDFAQCGSSIVPSEELTNSETPADDQQQLGFALDDDKAQQQQRAEEEQKANGLEKGTGKETVQTVPAGKKLTLVVSARDAVGNVMGCGGLYFTVGLMERSSNYNSALPKIQGLCFAPSPLQDKVLGKGEQHLTYIGNGRYTRQFTIEQTGLYGLCLCFF